MFVNGISVHTHTFKVCKLSRLGKLQGNLEHGCVNGFIDRCDCDVLYTVHKCHWHY